MNPLHPRHMTPRERRAELCRILGLGLIRLTQSSGVTAAAGESSLGFRAPESGHATPNDRREA